MWQVQTLSFSFLMFFFKVETCQIQSLQNLWQTLKLYSYSTILCPGSPALPVQSSLFRWMWRMTTSTCQPLKWHTDFPKCQWETYKPTISSEGHVGSCLRNVLFGWSNVPIKIQLGYDIITTSFHLNLLKWTKSQATQLSQSASLLQHLQESTAMATSAPWSREPLPESSSMSPWNTYIQYTYKGC